jgi:hypothetical protein
MEHGLASGRIVERAGFIHAIGALRCGIHLAAQCGERCEHLRRRIVLFDPQARDQVAGALREQCIECRRHRGCVECTLHRRRRIARSARTGTDGMHGQQQGASVPHSRAHCERPWAERCPRSSFLHSVRSTERPEPILHGVHSAPHRERLTHIKAHADGGRQHCSYRLNSEQRRFAIVCGSSGGRDTSVAAMAAPTRSGYARRAARHSTTSLPFMIAQWPGNEQKNE